jgi:hypothetical protein
MGKCNRRRTALGTVVNHWQQSIISTVVKNCHAHELASLSVAGKSEPQDGSKNKETVISESENCGLRVSIKRGPGPLSARISFVCSHDA